MLPQVEVMHVKVKTKDLVEAITNRFDQYLKAEKAKIDIEAEKTKIINADKLVYIYANLEIAYPEFKEEFVNRKNRRIAEITPSYKTSTSYQDDKTVKDRVIEFTLNNDTYTFDQVYQYATSTLSNTYK